MNEDTLEISKIFEFDFSLSNKQLLLSLERQIDNYLDSSSLFDNKSKKKIRSILLGRAKKYITENTKK